MTSVVDLPSGAVVTVAPPTVPAVQAAPPTTPPLVLLPSPGPRGGTGPAGDGAQVFGESAAGSKDGSNVVFTLANAYRAATTAVYLNGLRETNYAETGASEITFDDAPLSGETITVDYVIA
jgi:hypothetical protein